MKVYVAMIMHEYGATGLAGRSEKERTKKVANWCREHWPNRDTRPDELNRMYDQYVIEHYFALNRTETCFWDEDEIVVLSRCTCNGQPPACEKCS